MSKILELIDFLDEKSKSYDRVTFGTELKNLMTEAMEEYKATLPSPLPDDFKEIG